MPVKWQRFIAHILFSLQRGISISDPPTGLTLGNFDTDGNVCVYIFHSAAVTLRLSHEALWRTGNICGCLSESRYDYCDPLERRENRDDEVCVAQTDQMCVCVCVCTQHYVCVGVSISGHTVKPVSSAVLPQCPSVSLSATGDSHSQPQPITLELRLTAAWETHSSSFLILHFLSSRINLTQTLLIQVGLLRTTSTVQ